MTPFKKKTELIWLESTDSTNAELRRQLDRLDNLSVIATVEQTAGRGQGSHTWYASPGKNLTFSMLLRFPESGPMYLEASDALLLTCVASLSIRSYLEEKRISAGIKWPNDIWVDGRKICGMLIENRLEGSRIKESIIGIGLNINETGWPAELPNPVSLTELTGEQYDIRKELEILSKTIRRRYNQLGSPDGRTALQEEFGKYMFRLDGEQQS